MNKSRLVVGVLSLSAAGLISIAASENYTDNAVIPTKNDRPTLGFGSTFHEDGTPVKLGDTTTPVRALVTLRSHVSREEGVFQASLPGVKLTQGEYDVYVGWVYQYGSAAWRRSEMRKDLLSGDYRGACEAMLAYRYITSARPTPGWTPYRFDEGGQPTRWKFDCSTPGNKVCAGVWSRQQDRHARCLAEQEDANAPHASTSSGR